jgi:hypothetical protein
VACGSIKPTATDTSYTSHAKLLTTIRSAVEGGCGQAAASAFVKWVSQDGDGEPSDIDTDERIRNQWSVYPSFFLKKKELYKFSFSTRSTST